METDLCPVEAAKWASKRLLGLWAGQDRKARFVHVFITFCMSTLRNEGGLVAASPDVVRDSRGRWLERSRAHLTARLH